MKLCDYCNLPITEGQRPLVIASSGNSDEPVHVKAVYHRRCYRQERREMAEGADPTGKYGEIKCENKKFLPGEPVFLIRATDPFATTTVVEYARRCQREGCDVAHVDAVFDHAIRIADWQRNNPEQVKGLPD